MPTNPRTINNWIMLKPILVRALVLLAASANLFATDTLFRSGSHWRYWDKGSEPAPDNALTWKDPNYPESGWKSGPGQLGYGDGDEFTRVEYGPNAAAKYITTYFRATFNLADPSAYKSISLRLTRDDGAVVYVNGVEAGSFNMPTQPTYSTYASTVVEDTVDIRSLPLSLFRPGLNQLAVEVHQANAGSSDLSFDLELLGMNDITRGPYLQMGTSTNIVVRWRTADATSSVIRYGTSTDTTTWLEARSNTATTEHEVRLDNLQPNTRYFYSVLPPAPSIEPDYDHVFYTAPGPGTSANVRVWVLGDSGTADAKAAAVRNAYFEYAPSDYTDLVLMLGDNAYNNGLDSEYQVAVFDMYSEILRQSVLWPTIGNHDTAGSTTHNPESPYFKMFTLPTQAEAGGVPSGTENYYSFDFANIHFVCLDSMTSSRLPDSAMLSWLHSDLTANTLPWVIAFWHHPPYSKGSHDSDNDAEIQMADMRRNVLPILDSYNVDLVLAGHSHSYERSYLLSGHYGKTNTLEPHMILDRGTGRDNDESGSYNKATGAATANEGAVYIVAGSSGKKTGGSLNHPAMFLSLNELGSLVLDVTGNKLDVKFLRETNMLSDYFSIVKGNDRPITQITSPADPSSFANEQEIQITATASDPDIGDSVKEVVLIVNGATVATNVGPAESYAFNWFAQNGSHALAVRARDSKGVTSTSAPVKIIVGPTPPLAPSALQVVAVSSSAIDLGWADNSLDESGFHIFRSTDNLNFTLVTTTEPNVTSYSNNGLTPATTYYYRVTAFNSGGSSAAVSGYAKTHGPAEAPTGLSASAKLNEVTLSWTDSPNETGYFIERKNGKRWEKLATLEQDAVRFVNTGLNANTVYTYRVHATNQLGGGFREISVKTLRK